jgi:uncharacterized RmlC-like cupin family protein
MNTHGNCVVVQSGEHYDCKQGGTLAGGVSSQTADGEALRLHLLMIPPGTRGMPHYLAEHESAIYAVSGETEVWHGPGLTQRTIVRAGDFMYVPPGTPHLPVNRGALMSVSVVARAAPDEQESVVIVELPRHLADLLSFPVAIQE